MVYKLPGFPFLTTASHGGLSDAHKVAQSPVARLFLLWSQPQGPPCHHKPQESTIISSRTPKHKAPSHLGRSCASAGSYSILNSLDTFCINFDFLKKCDILSTLIMEVLGVPSNCAPQVSASLTSPRVQRMLHPSERSSSCPDA